MVNKENREFQIRMNDVSALFDELKKWDIEPETCEEGFKFCVQSNNVCYTVIVYVIENFTLEEQLFMFNLYPHIKTFADIQMKLFNKVIWNWK